MAPISNTSAKKEEPTFTLLHGFTNTSATWGAVLPLLSQAYGVQPLDLPGHGSSHSVRQNLVDYGRTLSQQLTNETVLLGYSLGGRVALHCALEQPRGLRALVLIGATAGIDDPQERAARQKSDVALAARLRASQDLEGFLDEWLAGPLFSRLTDEQQQRTGRLHNTIEGLASSLERMGVGTQEPLWDRLHTISVPTLVLAGEYDEKFTALGQRLAGAIHEGRFMSIAGAGHAVHLEQPEQTAQVIVDFVRNVSN